MPPALQIDAEGLATLCRAHGVSRLWLFGSALRTDFDPARSDIDLVVGFAAHDLSPWMSRFFAPRRDLEAALGQPVDLHLATALPVRRVGRAIQHLQTPLYAAA